MTKEAKSSLNHRFKECLKMQLVNHILEYCQFKTEQTPYTAIQLKDRSREGKKNQNKQTKTAKNKPRQDSCLDICINRVGPGFLL